MRTLLLIGILAFPLGVSASSSQPVYQQRTMIDFGSAEFEGTFLTPDGSEFEGHKNRVRESLVKLRTHFRTEILTSLRR